jgi:acyl carrier protein
MTSTEAATQLLASALGVSEAEISDETSITYSDEWDSLAHFRIIFALEEQIDRKMSPLEIFELSNFESVVEILARR